MNEELIIFEVVTHYKSGRFRTETIASKSEKTMWQYYDNHHNQNLVESSTIVDTWLA